MIRPRKVRVQESIGTTVLNIQADPPPQLRWFLKLFPVRPHSLKAVILQRTQRRRGSSEADRSCRGRPTREHLAKTTADTQPRGKTTNTAWFATPSAGLSRKMDQLILLVLDKSRLKWFNKRGSSEASAHADFQRPPE